MKKFEIGGIYKAVANAETISACTYSVQIKALTAHYVTATTDSGTARYKIKTDDNGVESINIARYTGRRALICKADSKVEMPLAASNYQDKTTKAICELFGILPTQMGEMTREEKIAAIIAEIGDCQYELDICQKQLDYYDRCIDEIKINIAESKDADMAVRLTYYQADLEECYDGIKEANEKAAKYEADIQRLKKTLAALENVTEDEYIAEDDGSNDDPDEDEIAVTYKVDEEEEDDEDELVDPPEVEENVTKEIMPTSKKAAHAGTLDFGTRATTYHVLAVADNGLTFDGKRISREKASAEIVAAYNQSKFSPDKNYSARLAVLLLDDRAFYYVRKFVVLNSYGVRENIQFVDFGRDEIPYINAKVQAIVDAYKKQAQKADAEKAPKIAAEIAYKASPQYQLDALNKQIRYYEEDLDLLKGKIRGYSRFIVDTLKWIADYENTINEYGLQIEEIKAKIVPLQKAQKFFTDAVATENAFKAINAAAAEIVDDGSNDDYDEDEIAVIYQVGEEEEVDDELVDPPHINTIVEAVENVPLTFELQNFTAKTVTTDNYATIDTAVTLASTPPLSTATETALETAMHNKNVFKKTIKVQQRRIEHFENEIFKAEQTIMQSKREIERLKKQQRELQEAIIDCENFIRQSSPIETTNAVPPLIDTDTKLDAAISAESKKYVESVQSEIELDKQIEELKKQIEELQAQTTIAHKNKQESEMFFYETYCQLQDWVSQTVNATISEGKKFTLIYDDSKKLHMQGKIDARIVHLYADEKMGKIGIYISGDNTQDPIADYSTVKQVKAAVLKLVAAIERGDTEFTFPIDNVC